jgi:tetratricopeptide (TPR) repeat protein
LAWSIGGIGMLRQDSGTGMAMAARVRVALALGGVLLVAGCTGGKVSLVSYWPWRDRAPERAAAAMDARDYAMALPFYEELAERNPKDPIPHYQMARIHEALGRKPEAIAHYQAALAQAGKTKAPLSEGREGEPLVSVIRKKLEALGAPTA